MRISLVLLSIFVPALFSSLLAVSALAEGEGVQKTANESIVWVEASSSLLSDLEQDTLDTSYDEADKGTIRCHLFLSREYSTSRVSSLLASITKVVFRANAIRGPPSIS